MFKCKIIGLRRFVGVFALCLIALAAAQAAYGQEGPIAGGYSDTDVKDEGVVAAARFAVRRQSARTSTKISLVSIRNAKVQVVSGLNYELCLRVSVARPGGRTTRQYVRVVVYRNLKRVYSLTSWTRLKNGAGC